MIYNEKDCKPIDIFAYNKKTSKFCSLIDWLIRLNLCDGQNNGTIIKDSNYESSIT